MSKYTMELRELFTPIKFNPPIFTREEVEGFFKDYELSDYLTTEQIETIENAGLWNKDKLARKIIDHYYMRELGQETIGLWIHTVKYTMNELMEQYLPLIYNYSNNYNPLNDYLETFSKTGQVDNTGRSVSDSTNSGNSIGITSDTPQGRVSKANILAGDYATATAGTETQSASNNTTNTVSGSNSSDQYTKSIMSQKSVEYYKRNIIGLDNEIIEKLETCFMGLF